MKMNKLIGLNLTRAPMPTWPLDCVSAFPHFQHQVAHPPINFY